MLLLLVQGGIIGLSVTLRTCTLCVCIWLGVRVGVWGMCVCVPGFLKLNLPERTAGKQGQIKQERAFTQKESTESMIIDSLTIPLAHYVYTY